MMVLRCSGVKGENGMTPEQLKILAWAASPENQRRWSALETIGTVRNAMRLIGRGGEIYTAICRQDGQIVLIEPDMS